MSTSSAIKDEFEWDPFDRKAPTSQIIGFGPQRCIPETGRDRPQITINYQEVICPFIQKPIILNDFGRLKRTTVNRELIRYAQRSAYISPTNLLAFNCLSWTLDDTFVQYAVGLPPI